MRLYAASLKTSLPSKLLRTDCRFFSVSKSPVLSTHLIHTMSRRDSAPIIPQDHQQVAQILQALQAGTGNGKKHGGKKGYKCRKSEYQVEGTQLFVDSWKFNDWDYKRDDLPIYARGLFTTTAAEGGKEIVARGYDKFFNIDEVNDTCWTNIESFTQGPYELSVKENGCIIFVSGLEDGTLLVCSKHSTGSRGNAEKSHSVWCERWIDKHLAEVGKQRTDLAKELRQMNVTAIAELCDDNFEEHVLAYDEKAAGLYIHGINCNVPEFATWSSSKVHEFADKWGFKKAQYLVKETLDEVKTFLEGCAETGSFAGRDTEGFVVRCQKRTGGASRPLEDWFFKYKFEEPYLMYRQWREATKAVIAGKVPKYKKHQKITREYLAFARRQFVKNPGLSKEYNQNHGIIKLRNDFLEERGLKGSDIIKMEEAEGGDSTRNAVDNVILAPLATIGCGKTTVAVALARLFNWGHVQNDNLTGKGNRPQRFVTEVRSALLESPVVVADRNNHQKRERKQLIEDISKVVANAKFVALHYVHDPKDIMLPEIRRATRERVLERGDNHQTIQAGSKSQAEIIGIMEGFLTRFEPLDPGADPDNGFDEVIALSATGDSRSNLELVVTALNKAFPKLVPMVPSADELDAAIEFALTEYNPSIKHDLSFGGKNKDRANGSHQQLPMSMRRKGLEPAAGKAAKEDRIEYFCIRLPAGLVLDALEKTFAQHDAHTAYFFRQLSHTRRVQPGFHVTLIHVSGAKVHPETWARLSNQWAEARANQGVPDPILAKCNVALETVVWDGRVMAIKTQTMDPNWQSTNQTEHATVGTVTADVKPVQSNTLLSLWEDEGCTEKNDIRALEVDGRPELVGEVRAVTRASR